MKKTLAFILFVSLFFMVRTVILSHCEVSCGIYNDEMRFAMIEKLRSVVQQFKKSYFGEKK